MSEAGKAPNEGSGAGVPTPSAVPAGEAAPPNAKPIPDELMPIVNAKIDETLARILPKREEEWKARIAEEQRQAQLSDEQKLKETNAKLESELTALRARDTRNARVSEVLVKGGGKITPLLAGAVVDSWNGDWDAGKALESATNEAKALASTFGGAAAPIPPFPGAGGSPATALEALSDAEIQRRVREGKLSLDDANNLWDERARSKAR